MAANRSASEPPSENPSRTARSDPAASITARTSSIRAASGGGSSIGTGSDSPVPRLSNRISLLIEASRRRNPARRGSCQDISRLDTQPGTNTRSTGPSPSTCQAMLTSPVRA
jgi:hypothetical protein